MIAALRVVGRGVGQFERYAWLYIVCNIVAALVSIPIITMPVAFAGLSRLSHAAQTSTTTDFGEFWSGMRNYFRHGLLIGIANLVTFGILWVNFTQYRGRTDLLFILLRIVWFTILVSWVSVQLYMWPILEEMDRPNLLLALRNAGIMALRNMGFTFILLTALIIIVALSTITLAPWLLLTGSLVACIANAAVIDRLNAHRSSTRSKT